MRFLRIIKKNKLLTVVIGVYFYLLIFNTSKGIEAFQQSRYYIIEMLEIIPVILIFTSLIEIWIPKETIMKNFGNNTGVKGAVFSFLIGSFSAGPIYAAFPVCRMLIKKGASIENIIIILSTWAVVKVPMLINEAKFLGFDFMFVRWILTSISIFIMAYIIGKIINRERVFQLIIVQLFVTVYILIVKDVKDVGYVLI